MMRDCIEKCIHNLIHIEFHVVLEYQQLEETS